MSAAELERLQSIVRDAIPIIEREAQELEDSNKYADGRIHDVDVLRELERLKWWLARARVLVS